MGPLGSFIQFPGGRKWNCGRAASLLARSAALFTLAIARSKVPSRSSAPRAGSSLCARVTRARIVATAFFILFSGAVAEVILPAAFLQNVEQHGAKDHQAQHNFLRVAFDARQVHAILNDCDNKR